MVVYQAVPCTICGCVCDDLEVTVEGNKIIKTKKACALSSSKLLNYANERILNPMVRRNGELAPTSLKDAIHWVAEMLVKAEYPVIYGWSLSSCEAIKMGIQLAEEVGGVIDNQTTVCHGPGLQGVHEIGMPTCTLGEVRNRADLIVYWGCNPTDAHPRHFERYTLDAEGRFVKSRGDRRIVVVDVRRTATARNADVFIQMEQGQDYELISAVRALLKFEDIEKDTVAGVTLERVEEFTELLRGCRYGIIFYGQGLTQTVGKERNIEAAIALVRDLNKWARFYLMPIRGHGNVTGANEVIAWWTGYPYAVDFSKSYPWYNPGETSVVDILLRKESDAALIVGSDPLAHFPRSAAVHLAQNPLAVIDPHLSVTALAADIVIPSAFTGIEAEGTFYRMDRVPLLTKKVIDPPQGILPDQEILKMILEEIRSLKKSGGVA